MRIHVAVLLAGILGACSKPSSPANTTGTSTTVTGTIVERLDGPPYSYLRVKTESGEKVWVAVPMAAVESGGRVTVTHGAALKNFTAPRIGKKFEVVTFGTLERR